MSSQHDPILQFLIKGGASLDKLGAAIPAKDKATIATNFQTITADFKKAVEMGTKMKAENDHLGSLRKVAEDYQKKMTDQAPLRALLTKIHDNGNKFDDALKPLIDDAKKKKDAKSLKLLQDVSDGFNAAQTDTASSVVFIGSS